MVALLTLASRTASEVIVLLLWINHRLLHLNIGGLGKVSGYFVSSVRWEEDIEGERRG